MSVQCTLYIHYTPACILYNGIPCLQATELINNELPGDVSYEIVTVVVQDVDDEKPEFNEKTFVTSVSEDISKIIRERIFKSVPFVDNNRFFFSMLSRLQVSARRYRA